MTDLVNEPSKNEATLDCKGKVKMTFAPTRRTGTVRTTVLSLIGFAALVMVGCGQAVHTAPPAAAPAPSRTCRSVGVATEADSGQTYCLARSAHLEVYLHGSAQDLWSPIKLDGDALRRIPSGKGTLALGVTGGFFIADHTGTARLSSVRRPCGTSAPAGSCRPPRTVAITIVVH
jgi:hypothetical protein